MPSKVHPHPEERLEARLEGRKTIMQPFVPILARPLREFRCQSPADVANSAAGGFAKLLPKL